MAKSDRKAEIIRELTKSYNMELETVLNYVAASTNPDGVRAEEIKKSLALDITAEIGHAQMLAKRIKQLGSAVPGSLKLEMSQKKLQPPKDRTDIVSVIKGVIDAEAGAVAQYLKIIKLCEGTDYLSQDLCIRLMADEEAHLVEFKGFLKEYEK